MARSILTQLDLNNIPPKNLVIEPVSTLPTTATTGRMVVLASNSKVYVGNGAEWKELGEAGPLPTIRIEDVTDLPEQLGLKATAQALTDLAAIVADKAAADHDHTIAGIIGLVAQLADIESAISGKAPSDHSHIASAISDFTTAVDARIIAYIEATAGSDDDLDTLREIIDMIKANSGALELMIGRHSADIGDGVALSIPVTHGLNSLDCIVEVYEKASGDTVICDIRRTSVNVVTFGFAIAPVLNGLRVVVKV